MITADSIRDFWDDNAEYGSKRGCYVFAIRNGGGLMPAYVGKATKTFEQEVFAPHKLNHYQKCLADYRRGTPVLFLVATDRRDSKSLSEDVRELEDFLIQSAVSRNPYLYNVRGTSAKRWSIAVFSETMPGNRPMPPSSCGKRWGFRAALASEARQLSGTHASSYAPGEQNVRSTL